MRCGAVRCGVVVWCGVVWCDVVCLRGKDDTRIVGAIPMISFNFNMGYAFVHGCSPLLSWHAFTPRISAKVLSGKQLRDVGPFWPLLRAVDFAPPQKRLREKDSYVRVERRSSRTLQE